ncbi:polymer-forming cytoskeletal protein [Alicyclobacillus dauci]|uniref:Polymer-forming cytoskeletal protein n=1 Tax=Alicyclobacillus dauci TaxID=1475485 RepID=A0ABY6Z586_9BACL|nr:polymer-forming cytoskeletal protein [Alicyclobacillus dauci]WAH37361.1 polymer-forming cytoskeletal protein [Alicyclobacillus dauci]
MDANRRLDLDLSGVGSASGGVYEDVRVEGVGKVHGDIQCNRCDVQGVSEIAGSVRANSVVIRGKAKVMGDVTADRVRVEGMTHVSGTCNGQQKVDVRGKVSIGRDIVGDVIVIDGMNRVEGDCRGTNVNIRGRTRIAGGLFAEDVLLEGAATIGGSCESETFRCDGSFSIEGLLNSGRVLIRLERNSTVTEIGGGEIRVERGRGSGFLSRNRRLKVDVIEGDDIYLEHTTAKIVRGNHVTLGPAAEVDRVEYRSQFRKLGGGKAGEAKQV